MENETIYSAKFEMPYISCVNFKEKESIILSNIIKGSRLGELVNFDGYANISFDEDKSPGAIVIQEFLRNMIDTPYNKTELLFQFEYFLLNKKNDEKRSNNDFNWYYLTENEIKIFFKGFYSNISHSKINGFLYHCGNINFNKIAAEQCLEFLKKLCSYLSSPHY